MNESNNLNTLLLIVILLAIVGGGVWWYKTYGPGGTPQKTEEPGLQINLQPPAQGGSQQ